jgi:hypothetical protein
LCTPRLRHIDVGKADGTERSVARLGHPAKLAGRQVKVNAAIPRA